jgi:predicted nucleotidyltransferase
MQLYQALLAKLARTLDGAGISYMIIGGQAVLLHGEPRLTRDIDVTLGCDTTELERILSITGAADLHPVVEKIEDFVRKTNVLPVRDSTTGIRVDLIFSFTLYETEAIRRSITVRLGDTNVHFASIEDLIIHKLVAGRPRDLEDVRGVLSRRPVVDEKYLTLWLSSFRDIVHRDLVSEYLELKIGRSDEEQSAP